MTMELAPTQSFVGNKCHCSECLHRIDENDILAAVFWIKDMKNHNWFAKPRNKVTSTSNQ